jgi:hypothetical protein
MGLPILMGSREEEARVAILKRKVFENQAAGTF